MADEDKREMIPEYLRDRLKLWFILHGVDHFDKGITCEDVHCKYANKDGYCTRLDKRKYYKLKNGDIADCCLTWLASDEEEEEKNDTEKLSL